MGGKYYHKKELGNKRGNTPMRRNEGNAPNQKMDENTGKQNCSGYLMSSMAHLRAQAQGKILKKQVLCTLKE